VVNGVLDNLRSAIESSELVRRPPHQAGRGGWFDIEQRIFRERHFLLYGSAIAAAMVIVSALRFWQGASIVSPTGKFAYIDFCWIWVSGVFAASSDPSQVYDFGIYSAAQSAVVEPMAGAPFFHFNYPPTALFFTYLLGFLPYLAAYAVWIGATLGLYLGTIYAIVRRPAALIAAVLPIAVSENALLGQNGFLTAALVGSSLVLLERRPACSGLLIGLLTYKPHFGVLFPLALGASRKWRALGSAMISSVALGAAATVAFGCRGWPVFIGSLFSRNASLSPDSEVQLNLQSVYGLVHWAGAGTWISWAAHLTIAAVVAAIVCTVWARPIAYGLKAAILCLGSVTVSPYLLGYDLCILSVAVAFLVRDGMSRGFLPGERIGMLICFAALFAVTLPVAPLVCATLFLLAGRRIAAGPRDRATPSDLTCGSES
jgi:hypothetical protein